MYFDLSSAAFQKFFFKILAIYCLKAEAWKELPSKSHSGLVSAASPLLWGQIRGREHNYLAQLYADI